MKRCVKCILPETYPNITYDDQGVCVHCNSHKATVYKGEDALRELLKQNPSQSNWDCLVPLSGGRDSTYTLYKLVKKYNLRVLVYNYDNGFVEEIAKENIRRIADQLNVEVVYRGEGVNWQRLNVKYLTEMNLRKTPGHVQSFLCSGCRNGIWGGAYAVAEEYQIPLIFFGESAMESGTFKTFLTPQFTPTTSEKISFMLKMPVNFFNRKYVARKLEKEFPLQSESVSVKKVNFFDFEEWNEKAIMDVIQDKMNWQHKVGQSAWRFDCQIHALVNKMVFQMLGMTEKDELYSKMIREGYISREEALEKIRISKEAKRIEMDVIRKVLDKIELGSEERKMIVRFCEGEPRCKNTWK